VRATPILLVALAIVGVGCRDDGGNTVTSPAPTTAPSAVGPAISIDQARARSADTPVAVRGFLVIVGDEARLCDALAESFPPQCGGSSIMVEGLDLSAYDVTVEGDVTWTDQPVVVLGSVAEDVLVVAAQG